MRYFLFLFILYSVTTHAQMTNWYDSDLNGNGPYTISTDKAYSEIIGNKKAQEIIVAIIDSGVDAEHEDLKDIMWVNYDEIPNNGIDDDGNGYIDDIHGWNFIGNANGENVVHDSYEMTRLYAVYKKKFGDRNTVIGLSGDDVDQYADYKKWEKKIEKERNGAQDKITEYEATEQFYLNVMDSVFAFLRSDSTNQRIIDTLNLTGDPMLMLAGGLISDIHKDYGVYPTISDIRSDVVTQFTAMKADANAKYGYHYNPDYNPRLLIGDNYTDLEEIGYGNNDVEGPDAMHGTHVAGIVGAVRNNEIGFNGIADNVKIMSVRAVPDGDERDKDVANAIRYAVDNGARVINMSFGKGQSPEKEAVDKAVRYAEKNDVLLVHAAGNDGSNNDIEDNFPCDLYEKGFGFLFFKKKRPNNWLEIGALSNYTDSRIIASFSNYGKEQVDLFAPGLYMLSCIPDNDYQILQGTSMAAPVVSGVAAVIRGFFPSLKAKEVKEILMESSIKPQFDVIVPGQDPSDTVPFKDLSVSGGTLNLYSALKLAEKRTGEKIIKRSSKSNEEIKAANNQVPASE